MPTCNFVVVDTTTGLYLTYYSTTLANCLWGIIKDAICFNTQEEADAVVASWGDQGGRFQSSNPPNPHH